MKKLILACIVTVLLLLVTGCSTLSIACGIDDQMDAYIAYHLVVDVSEESEKGQAEIAESLNGLCNHLESMGYTVEQSSFEDSVEIRSIIKQEADSYPEAFKALEQLLTDDNGTPFIHVNTASYAAGYEQAFILEAQTDFYAVMKAGGLEQLPPHFRDRVDEVLANCSGEIVLTLPASEAVEGNGAFVGAGGLFEQRTPIDFQNTTTARLVTRLNTEGGMPLAASAEETLTELKEELAQSRKALYMVAGILAALGVIAVIVGIKIAKKKRREGPRDP